MFGVRKSLIVGLLGIAGMAASPARADLYLYVGATQVAHQGANDEVTYDCNGTCNPLAPNWMHIHLNVQGTLEDPFPELFIGSNVDATAGSGAGQLTLTMAENHLTAGGVESFLSSFGGRITGNITSDRKFYIDANDGNGSSLVGDVLVGEITTSCNKSTGCTSAIDKYGFADTGSGLYSIIEVLTLTPGSGTSSANTTDNFFLVPEPMSLSILGVSLLALGGLGWRRNKSDSNPPNV